jgi:hypothetical protein
VLRDRDASLQVFAKRRNTARLVYGFADPREIKALRSSNTAEEYVALVQRNPCSQWSPAIDAFKRFRRMRIYLSYRELSIAPLYIV